MAITRPTYATNNVRNLADIEKNNAANVKMAFDKTGEDTKNYISNTMLPEIESQFSQSADVITKTNTTPFTPVDPYNPSTKKYVDDSIQNVILGKIPDHTITNDKLAIGTDINIQLQFGSQTYNKLTDGSSLSSLQIVGNHYSDVNGFYTTINPSIKINNADGNETMTVIEGEFFSGETFKLVNGKIIGKKMWRTINSKELVPSHISQSTGYKIVKLPVQLMQSGNLNSLLKNWNGLLTGVSSFTSGNQFISSDGYVQISVPNTLSGFVDSIVPNSDEWIAFITKGWKATSNNGTRYTAWVSVVDGTTTPTTQTIDFVKSNQSANYQGYKIAYKLAVPEPSNESLETSFIDAKLKGKNPIIKNGFNTIVLDNGIVLQENATESLTTDSTYAYINNTAYLTKKVGTFLNIYKNNVIDTNWSFIPSLGYGGNGYMRCLISNYDPTAIYTVDYKLMQNEAQNIGSFSLSYNTGLLESIYDLQNQSNNKQTKDKALDRIVSLSDYEKIKYTTYAAQWYGDGNSFVIVRMQIPVKEKNSNSPTINVDKVLILTGTGVDVTSNFSQRNKIFYGSSVLLDYITFDTSIVTNIKNYGVASGAGITVSCFGR